MNIEFVDVFLKEERFIMVCGECYAAVVVGYHLQHAEWHEREGK